MHTYIYVYSAHCLSFFTTYTYYAHLAFVRFEHSVCHESLLTSFIVDFYFIGCKLTNYK